MGSAVNAAGLTEDRKINLSRRQFFVIGSTVGISPQRLILPAANRVVPPSLSGFLDGASKGLSSPLTTKTLALFRDIMGRSSGEDQLWPGAFQFLSCSLTKRMAAVNGASAPALEAVDKLLADHAEGCAEVVANIFQLTNQDDFSRWLDGLIETLSENHQAQIVFIRGLFYRYPNLPKDKFAVLLGDKAVAHDNPEIVTAVKDFNRWCLPCVKEVDKARYTKFELIQSRVYAEFRGCADTTLIFWATNLSDLPEIGTDTSFIIRCLRRHFTPEVLHKKFLREIKREIGANFPSLIKDLPYLTDAFSRKLAEATEKKLKACDPSCTLPNSEYSAQPRLLELLRYLYQSSNTRRFRYLLPPTPVL